MPVNSSGLMESEAAADGLGAAFAPAAAGAAVAAEGGVGKIGWRAKKKKQNISAGTKHLQRFCAAFTAQTLTCCMNSVMPWRKAGTPDVVTVMEGAPAPAPPKSELMSWLMSGGISGGWGSLPAASAWFWVGGAFADGGVGPEVEKEKEEEV